jgi:adenylate kinase
MAISAIILLGAPGAGKGTVAEILREKTSYSHISTGDMLRNEIKKNSPLGKEAEGYMKKGALVPDDLIIKMIINVIDAGGKDARYMFDGFPRTINQAEMLDKSFKERNGKISCVFLLELPEKVVIERLTGRRICRKCGTNYHIKNIPPKVAGVCDKCGGELYQRADDKEETIINRLNVFKQQTFDLIEFYEKKGIVKKIDSSRKIEETIADIMKIIKEL